MAMPMTTQPLIRLHATSRDSLCVRIDIVRRHKEETTLTNLLAGAWSARHVLTNDEARALQRDATEGSMRHVEVTSVGDKARLRDCTRCILIRPELAALMFERLLPSLEPAVVVDGSEEARLRGLPATDEELHGVWRPCGVNPHIRVCRYPGDGRGHFGPHVDGSIEVGPHERSLLTLNGYLNALPEGAGGRTRFLVDEMPMHTDEQGRFTVENPSETVLASIRPEEPGMAAVFFHGLTHDSEPLQEGAPPKWIFRTEVMYRRDPATAPQFEPEVALRRRIEKTAERCERDAPMRAMQLYQLGQKLRDGRVSIEAATARYEARREEPHETGGGDTDEENDLPLV